MQTMVIADEVHSGRKNYVHRWGALRGAFPPRQAAATEPQLAANAAVVGWAGRQLAPGGAGPGAWPTGRVPRRKVEKRCSDHASRGR